MRASELIDELQSLVQRHGDLEVVDTQDESIQVEFNDDEAPAFVIS